MLDQAGQIGVQCGLATDELHRLHTQLGGLLD
jgi:hypothetical protein